MLPGKKASKWMPTDVDRTGGVAPVRGAKRGGLTDHIAGMHLIPNVGREAMVPGECVRRQPRPQRKPEPKPKPQPIPTKKKIKHKEHRRDPSPRRNRDRSRDPSKERRPRSSSSEEEDSGERAANIHRELQAQRKEEDAQSKKDALEDEAKRRFAEEQKKLNELADVRKKTEEMQTERKKKLGGLFALTEEDIDEEGEMRKARIAKEKARAEKKVGERAAAEPARVGYADGAGAVRSSSSISQIVDESNAHNLTAADIDGSLHEHKFSKVWKDWDSQKKSDPGEIARQFMKIAAIKRRGFGDAQADRQTERSDDRRGGGGRSDRGYDRSRSRGRGGRR